ncbi:MAG: hypothetical protein HDS69_09745 [Bacteroidales bacterium]|nr:hypothetical protein [Bacteroidales bacterium]MBD5230295.1 hypothetical protein [Bacteroidales bacterium]MBD5259014.1 hypothetical protein [Barnesiella sp.]
MKLNAITAGICAFVAVLVAIALWQIPLFDPHKWSVALGSGVTSALTLIFGLATRYNNPSIGTNIRVLSTTVFVISLLFNIFIGLSVFSLVVYLVVSGLILAVYLLVLDKLIRVAKENPNI